MKYSFKEKLIIKIIDNLCELVYQRKFKQAEAILIGFIENTINHHYGITSLQKKKKTLQLIYHSFNKYYHNWIKNNNIDIRTEIANVQSLRHSNYLISHVGKIAEMDDLLYELSFFSVTQKDEILNNLICYKMNSH